MMLIPNHLPMSKSNIPFFARTAFYVQKNGMLGLPQTTCSTYYPYVKINPMNNKNKHSNTPTNKLTPAFTIIELLIVIVIIGVLVAITAVSYNGITKSAKETALKSELKQASIEVEVAKAKSGTPPSNTDSLTPTKSGTLSISTNTEQNSWCLTITPNSPNNQNLPNFNITSDSGTIQQGGCPFTSGGHIQTATKDSCPTTRTLAVDARDKSTYYIQKLADGNCWMLTNLAYAGGTSNGGTNAYSDVINQGAGTPGTPGTLNNGTADTATTFTLAKYYIHPTNSNPTIDPTPPSTATDGGTTNPQYGYLYNWCAAMGAQNTAACASAATPAPDPTINICPAGWRLPTGEPTTGEFTALNTAINGGLLNTDAGLRTNGLFQRSGGWDGGFSGQGSYGGYWSSSQYSSSGARNLLFYSTNVLPAYGNFKYFGYAVRCVAL